MEKCTIKRLKDNTTFTGTKDECINYMKEIGGSFEVEIETENVGTSAWDSISSNVRDSFDNFRDSISGRSPWGAVGGGIKDSIKDIIEKRNGKQ